MKRILFLLLIPFILYGQIERSSSGGIAEIDTTKYSTIYYVEGRVASIASSVSVLSTSKTVNFNSSMSVSEMQDSINAQPKNLNGYALTFQFADGTYTLDTQLLFRGFVEGTLKIFGNAADNSLSTTKSVTLEFTSAIGIKIESSCSIEVRYLKVSITNAGVSYGIYIVSNPYSVVRYNYVICSQTNGGGIFFLSSKSLVIDNVIGLSGNGIISDGNSSLYSENNDDGGESNQPIYGLQAGRNGTIGKSGTQPSGSSSNENVTGGGVIR